MNYPQHVKSALDWLMEILFPARCVLCGRLFADTKYVCGKCLNSINIKKSFECIGCGRCVGFGQTCYRCSEGNHIKNLFVISDYKDKKVQKIIKTFKYRFIRDMAGPLSDLACKYLRWLAKKGDDNFKDSPLLVPVPLSQYRYNWRGFNQSEDLSQILSSRLGLEFDLGLIKRDDSRPQADIDREERKNNLIGKFKFVGNQLKGRSILLIDDVCTTGATLNECAKVLKENGAGKIMALVIARG